MPVDVDDESSVELCVASIVDDAGGIEGNKVQQRMSTGNDSQPVAPSDEAVHKPLAHSCCLLQTPA